MAKMKEEQVLYVLVYCSKDHATGEEIPFAYHVRCTHEGGGGRDFESYGKDKESREYPLEKLPKAVQAFIEHNKRSVPILNKDQRTFVYQIGGCI